MSHCRIHGIEGDFFGGCPACKREREAADRLEEFHQQQTEAKLEAMERHHEESIWAQQMIADVAMAEQRKIAAETVKAQQINIANSWRLQAAAKIRKAAQMYQARLYEEARRLAQEALGERAESGDPGNIQGHYIAALSCSALDDQENAVRHFTTQIRLLRAEDYCDDIDAHLMVLGTLPKAKSLLEPFVETVVINSKNWNLSPGLFEIVSVLNQTDASEFAEAIADLILEKLDSCRYPLWFASAVRVFNRNGLSARSAEVVQAALRNVPRFFEDEQEVAKIVKLFRGWLLEGLVAETELLTEACLKMRHSFVYHVYRQETLFRRKLPYDGAIKRYISAIGHTSRESIFKDLVTLSKSDVISPDTLQFVRSKVTDRYVEWAILISEELKREALRKEGYSEERQWGYIIGGFLAALLCTPVALVVNSVFAYRIYGNIRKLRNAGIEFDSLARVESREWSQIWTRQIVVPQPKLPDENTALGLLAVNWILTIFLAFLPVLAHVIRK